MGESKSLALGLDGFHHVNPGVDFRQAYRWGLKGPFLSFTKACPAPSLRQSASLSQSHMLLHIRVLQEGMRGSILLLDAPPSVQRSSFEWGGLSMGRPLGLDCSEFTI